jgi:hypothetical protein
VTSHHSNLPVTRNKHGEILNYALSILHDRLYWILCVKSYARFWIHEVLNLALPFLHKITFNLRRGLSCDFSLTRLKSCKDEFKYIVMPHNDTCPFPCTNQTRPGRENLARCYDNSTKLRRVLILRLRIKPQTLLSLVSVFQPQLWCGLIRAQPFRIIIYWGRDLQCV